MSREPAATKTRLGLWRIETHRDCRHHKHCLAPRRTAHTSQQTCVWCTPHLTPHHPAHGLPFVLPGIFRCVVCPKSSHLQVELMVFVNRTVATKAHGSRRRASPGLPTNTHERAVETGWVCRSLLQPTSAAVVSYCSCRSYCSYCTFMGQLLAQCPAWPHLLQLPEVP